MPLDLTLEKALEKLAGRLQARESIGPVLLGGSCGLLLQGVRLNQPPQDIDLYVDSIEVPAVFKALQPYATDNPRYSETAMYSSLLSHFRILGMSVELVGGFQVRTEQGEYEVKVSRLSEACTSATIGSSSLNLMPLAHELVFNLLRARPDRYEAIAEKMREDPAQHMAVLTAILKCNKLGEPLTRKMMNLLKI